MERGVELFHAWDGHALVSESGRLSSQLVDAASTSLHPITLKAPALLAWQVVLDLGRKAEARFLGNGAGEYLEEREVRIHLNLHRWASQALTTC